MRHLRLMLLLPLLGRLMLADTNPGGGGNPSDGGGQGGGGTNPPAPTPVTFTPDQQAALDRIVEDRLQRDRAARPAAPANLAELQQKAAQLDQVLAASRTDQERAVQQATDAALRQGREAMVPLVVAAELRAASAGALTAEQAAAMAAPLSAAYFLGADGAVDPAKVTSYVTAAAAAGQLGAAAQQGAQTGQQAGQGQPGQQSAQQGAQTGQQAGQGQQGGQPAGQWPGMGQGARGTQPTSGKDAGMAEARRRWPDKYAQQGQQSA